MAVLSILLAVSGAFSVTAWRRHHPPGADATVRKFSLTPPVALAALYGDLGSYAFPGTSTAISPNGKHIAFTDSDARLWIQDLDRNEPRAIEGADGAALPFWSPDSQFIGFFVGRELKKVSVHGGPATTLCELPGPIFRGGTWSPDGSSIVFSSGQATPRLYEVLARGGSPELFIEPAESEQDANFHWPHFLPLVSDEAVLMFAQGSGRQHEIVIQELRTGLRQVLGPGTSPVYSPTGHIVFLTSPSIADTWALPFSLETLKATGEAFPVDQASYWPSVSGDGTLVYLDTSTSGQMQLVWRDRRGGKIGEIGQPQPTISEPALSPDGRFVAVSASEGSLPDMWIQDISRAVKSRLSFSPEDESRPVWSPDGKHVAYSHRHSGQSDILVKPADGSGEAQALVATEARFEMRISWTGHWGGNSFCMRSTIRKPGATSGISSASRMEAVTNHIRFCKRLSPRAAQDFHPMGVSSPIVPTSRAG